MKGELATGVPFGAGATGQNQRSPEPSPELWAALCTPCPSAPWPQAAPSRAQASPADNSCPCSPPPFSKKNLEPSGFPMPLSSLPASPRDTWLGLGNNPVIIYKAKLPGRFQGASTYCSQESHEEETSIAPIPQRGTLSQGSNATGKWLAWAPWRAPALCSGAAGGVPTVYPGALGIFPVRLWGSRQPGHEAMARKPSSPGEGSWAAYGEASPPRPDAATLSQIKRKLRVHKKYH